MKQQKVLQPGRTINLGINIALWIYVFTSPIIFRHNDAPASLENYLRDIVFPLTGCVVFYVNYFLLVPNLLRHGWIWRFVGQNLTLIVLLVIFREEIFPVLFPLPRVAIEKPVGDLFHQRWLMYIRSFLSLGFVAIISICIRLSLKWRTAEEARQEAELKRIEAELTSLKIQINPHFLLNTLNSIYVLTAIDAKKAQQAIQRLSKMMRYLLYENKEKLVSLQKEITFLDSYIALMRIRLGENTQISKSLCIPDHDVEVAPLIFICLVENAFKHGVSPTAPSYIRFNCTANDTAIVFRAENSYFPKDSYDKRPGGIGLQQVERRLELLYPNRYEWQRGVTEDGKSYISEITIHYAVK